MTRVLIAGRGLCDWRAGLAKPDLHWKRKASAFELAVSWERAQRSDRGIPEDVLEILDQHPKTCGCAALLVVPEHKVEMPGRGKPSQNDAWVLARGQQGLVSIAVEGKAGEPFDKQVGAWLDAGRTRTNRQKRLDGMCAILGSAAPDPTLRYQLFHRGASAILEAKRCGAPIAVLMVQVFGDMVDLRDVEHFCAYLNAVHVAQDLFEVPSCTDVNFFIGWAKTSPASDAAIAEVAG